MFINIFSLLSLIHSNFMSKLFNSNVPNVHKYIFRIAKESMEIQCHIVICLLKVFPKSHRQNSRKPSVCYLFLANLDLQLTIGCFRNCKTLGFKICFIAKTQFRKYFQKWNFSSYHQDCGRAAPKGWEPDLLRPRFNDQAEVHGGEHSGGAAGVHHLEEGQQDAQLWHGERRHQVSCSCF